MAHRCLVDGCCQCRKCGDQHQVYTNRHQQVPKETEGSKTKIFVRNPDDPWVPRDTANDIPKIEWICDL